MAQFDAEAEDLWREATRLIGEAYTIALKVDQGSEPPHKTLYDFLKRVEAFENRCDEKNVLTMVR